MRSRQGVEQGSASNQLATTVATRRSMSMFPLARVKASEPPAAQGETARLESALH